MGKLTNQLTNTYYDPISGNLFINRSGAEHVLSAWPEIDARRKTQRDSRCKASAPRFKIPFHTFNGDISRLEAAIDRKGQSRLLFSISSDEQKKREDTLNMYKWVDQIPVGVRWMVGRFSCRQWEMLSFLAHCGPEAKDIVISNPALAFMIANHRDFQIKKRHWNRETCRSVAKMKQREILPLFGFPGTKSMRKILSKIVSGSITLRNLAGLRKTIKDGNAKKVLSHLRRINTGALRIITNKKLFKNASPSLIEEISGYYHEDCRPETAWLLDDCINLLHFLKRDHRFLKEIKYCSSIDELHDSLMDDIHRDRLRYQNINFPEPPLEGNSGVIPITSSDELYQESIQQKNCVAVLLDKICRQKNYYLYLVTSPERATLGLRLVKGKWLISQLGTAQNKPASEETHFAVVCWYCDRRNYCPPGLNINESRQLDMFVDYNECPF